MENNKNNKIIAEFMGFKYNKLKVKKWEDTNGWQYSELEYDSSWDWLMPVLNKISKIATVEDSERKGLEQRLNPYIYNMNDIYEGVIEFIKWYNVDGTN